MSGEAGMAAGRIAAKSHRKVCLPEENPPAIFTYSHGVCSGRKFLSGTGNEKHQKKGRKIY